MAVVASRIRASSAPLVVGYYGMQNIGDDAFCIIMNWGLTRYWGSQSPMFAAPPLAELPAGRARMDPELFLSSGVLKRTARVATKAALLRQATMLVFGGGSVFRDMGRVSEKRLFTWWSRARHRPMAAIGVSIGPFVSSAAKARLAGVLDRLSYLAVRDRASVDRLEDAGVTREPVVAADLVGLLPEALGWETRPTASDAAQRPRLGVTLLGRNDVLADDVRSRREQALIDGIRAFVRTAGVDVSLLVFNTHPVKGDVAPSSRLAAALADVCAVRTVSAGDGVTAMWREVNRCHAGLHMRLHGGVFAFMAGTPFALVPYHDKCNDFLDEIGQPQSRRLPNVPMSAADVQQVLTALFENRSGPTMRPSDFADKARLNFTRAPWSAAHG